MNDLVIVAKRLKLQFMQSHFQSPDATFPYLSLLPTYILQNNSEFANLFIC